jgi:hypothetical protein
MEASLRQYKCTGQSSAAEAPLLPPAPPALPADADARFMGSIWMLQSSSPSWKAGSRTQPSPQAEDSAEWRAEWRDDEMRSQAGHSKQLLVDLQLPPRANTSNCQPGGHTAPASRICRLLTARCEMSVTYCLLPGGYSSQRATRRRPCSRRRRCCARASGVERPDPAPLLLPVD